MVLIVVTTARRPPILQSPERDPNLHVRYGTFKPPTLLGGATAQPTDTMSQHLAATIGHIVLGVMLVLALLVLLWLIVAIAVAAIRRRRLRLRISREGPLPEADDAVLDAVGRATRRQQRLLQDGAPSNAIVACWVDLEQAAGAAGVSRRPSETSAELTIRMLDEFDVDHRALRTLGRLYREARYSAHPITERDRQSARAALDALHRSLPAVADAEQV